MRKLLIPLVALVLVALVAWFAWTSLRSERGAIDSSGASADALVAALPETSDSSVPGAPAPEPLAATPGDERAAAATEKAGKRTWDPAQSVRVGGRVSLAGGTPADERVEVFAFEKPVDLAAVARESELAAGDEGVALARAEAVNGAFELALPPDLAQVHVFALGRYSASSAAVAVDVPAKQPLELATDLGTWVSGRVQLPSGGEADAASLAGMTVTLDPDVFEANNGALRPGMEGPTERKARVGADLTFEFRAVGRTKKFNLVAQPQGDPPRFAAAKSAGLAAGPGEHVRADIVLTRGGSLAGRVVDETGAPVADAELTVRIDPRMFGLGGDLVRKTRSGSDGSFLLGAVTAGRSKLRAESPGHLEEAQDLDLAEGEQRTGALITLTHGARVAGHVYWPDRTPAADVPIDLSFDLAQMSGMGAFNAWRGAKGSARSAADGAFEIRGLGKGPFTVTSNSPPRGSQAKDSDPKLAWRARLDGVAPESDSVELVLREPQGIAGRVLDDAQAPIRRFHVAAQQKTKSVIPGLGGENTGSDFDDAEGRFVLTGMMAGEWQLYATAEGYGEPEPVTVVLPLAAGTEELAIVLQRSASAKGVVLGADGSPAASGRVELRQTLQDFGRRLRPGHKEPVANVGEGGAFLLEGLTAGKLTLVASATDSATSEPQTIELAPGETREGLTLSLREGGRLTGEVYGDGGKPAVGVNVMAQVPTLNQSQRFVNTDSQGRFAIAHMEPGSWQVLTLPGERATRGDDSNKSSEPDMSAFLADMKITMADIVEGQETHVVLGALPADPVHVHGRVLAGGVPVASVMVNFMRDGAKGLGSLKMLRTDADGAFAADVDEPGRYLVTVQKIGGTGSQQSFETSHTIPKTTDYELDIDLPVGTIAGRVLDTEGKPLSGARVSLGVDGAVPNGTLTGGRFSEIMTDARGEYLHEWLQPGSYTVSAGGQFMGGILGGEDAPGREVRNGISISAGQHLADVDFRLKPSGRIAGIVRDHSGNPIAEAAIFVRDDKDRLIDRLSMAQTDGEGRFKYGGLAQGSYKVLARGAGQVTGKEVEVAVRPGETAQVELALESGTIVIITLLDEQETEVEARVMVTDDKGRQVNGLMSLSELMTIFTQGGFSSKEQRVGPLPPGKYKVSATYGDGHTVSKAVTLNGQPERKLILRLKE